MCAGLEMETEETNHDVEAHLEYVFFLLIKSPSVPFMIHAWKDVLGHSLHRDGGELMQSISTMPTRGCDGKTNSVSWA